MPKKETAQTPLMKQYYQIKAQFPGTLVLFRVGDFYEMFEEDAVKASQILGIALTKRANGAASQVDLAGFPYHALDHYLPKLVAAGLRVAICDQLEDPAQAKGRIVKRGVTEVVSPGVHLHDKLLTADKSNYIASIHPITKNTFAIAFLDLSSGDFFVDKGDSKTIENLLHTFEPSEILLSKDFQKRFHQFFSDHFYVTPLDPWLFEHQFALERLYRHFGTTTLKGFGFEDDEPDLLPAGVLLHYLEMNEHHSTPHIQKLYRLARQNFMEIDRFTLRNLEILSPLRADGVALIQIIDHCQTPMGKRLLRRWLSFPLIQRESILQRQQRVEIFFQNSQLRNRVRLTLQHIHDTERLMAKMAMRKLNPYEAIRLKHSLKEVFELVNIFQDYSILMPQSHLIPQLTELTSLIEKTIQEDASSQINGQTINAGVSPRLDELRAIKSNAEAFLQQLLQKEIQRTGIPSLKIGFNKVFGYYLEVSNAHKHKVPSDYIRKQTLTQAERYITPELKEFETRILSADEEILHLENELYDQFLTQCSSYIEPLKAISQWIAEVDIYANFAFIADKFHYVKPEIFNKEEGFISIEGGRHPVIEQCLPPEKTYVPNDLYLDTKKHQILIITGPNMAGKSALLRQTALITLLAQVGSFVPAQMAQISIVDKIFTRVGASDNLAAGESTFLVEMIETAYILHHASPHSLILLDEIGRGTSTYDGIAIAWALVEYIHDHVGAKTLFATHFHELAELEKRLERVHNFHIAVKEANGKLIFLRQCLPGHSEHSFGIHVAEMAGVPPLMTERAKMILEQLEQQRTQQKAQKLASSIPAVQLHLFETENPAVVKLLTELQNLQIETLSPIQALLKLKEFQELIR